MKKRGRQPKHAPNPQAFMVAISGAMALDTHDQLTRAARVRASVDQLIAGDNSVPIWRDIFDAVNMLIAFGRSKVIKTGAKELGEELMGTVAAAMDRQKATGSNCLRPVEIDSLRYMCQVWAEVLSIVSCREYFEAEEYVKRVVFSALRQGSHGSVRVLEAA